MRRAYAIRRSRAADWASLCGGLVVPVIVLAALGSRTGLVPTPALVPVLVVAFVLGLLAWGLAIYALSDIWRNGAEGARTAVAGMFFALPALVLLGVIAAAAIHYPRLTDVTTNPEDPPEFSVHEPAGGPPDAEQAARQQAAYPDLATRTYPLPLGEVYAAARDLIEQRGWTIVQESRPTVMPEASPEAGPQVGESEELLRALASKSVMTQSRGAAGAPTVAGDGGQDDPQRPAGSAGNVVMLEATARTLVFGFSDQVVVRMRGTPEGTVVDMRSASHVGEHDLGQNARRIRGFFARLDAALQPDGSAASGVASAGQ